MAASSAVAQTRRAGHLWRQHGHPGHAGVPLEALQPRELCLHEAEEDPLRVDRHEHVAAARSLELDRLLRDVEAALRDGDAAPSPGREGVGCGRWWGDEPVGWVTHHSSVLIAVSKVGLGTGGGSTGRVAHL